jgi:hypothetical protein
LGVELLLNGPHDVPVEKISPVELIIRASTVIDSWRPKNLVTFKRT